MTGWVETEVTRSHPHYQLLGELRNKPEGLLFPLLHSDTIRAGLPLLLAEAEDGAKLQLSPEDYEAEETVSLGEARLTAHAPRVFCALRSALGVNTEQFLSSAAPRDPDTSYKQCVDIYTQPTSNCTDIYP